MEHRRPRHALSGSQVHDDRLHHAIHGSPQNRACTLLEEQAEIITHYILKGARSNAESDKHVIVRLAYEVAVNI